MNVKSMMAGTALAFVLATPMAAQDEPDVDLVVATVGDTDITLGHMIDLRQRLPAEFAQAPDAQLFGGILEQLIRQEALAQQVEEIPRRVDLSVQNHLRAELATEVVRQTAEAATSDEAIEAAYQETFGNQEAGTEWNAAHILLESEEAAADVKAEIDAGADFADVARERSTGPSGPNGGALGWFGPGMMVPEFEEAISGLEPGGVSEPFETQFGWHVAMLNEVREATPPPLDAVREDIVAQLQDEAIEARIEAATDAVDVSRPDLGDLNPGVLNDPSLLE